MEYEIFSYGNVDALTGLFNALAAIMAGSTFRSAIAIVVVVGFFASFLAFAFSPQRMAGPKWLATVLLIYLVMFVPKATVHVVDKTGMGPPGVIDNVPLGLAAQAGVVSSIGSTLTDLFEMALTVIPGSAGLPAEMTFTNNGLMFGARMVERSRKITFTDPRTRTDVANFFKNCTFYDVSQGFIPADEFANSTDLWGLASRTNPARFTPVTDLATNIMSPETCTDAYPRLSTRMGLAANAMLERLGLELHPHLQLSGAPTLSGADALSLMTAQLPVAYHRAKIGAAADSAASLVLQNAMINAVGDASRLTNQAQGDPTAMLMHLARAQATTQLNSQSIASAGMMSEALPLIRNGIEAVLYGIFPFVLLLALVFGSLQAVQLLRSYALALVWIALWPPIYAIINYLGVLSWAKKAAAAGYLPALGDTGMTVATAGPIVDATMTSLSTMGNMVLAVPMIAGAVVFGLNRIAGMAMTMSQAVTSATGPIANQAAIGNVGLGNVRFQDQSLSPNRTSAFMERSTDIRGTSMTDVRDGEYRFDQNIGKSAVSLTSSAETATRFNEMSAKSHAAGLEKTRAAQAATVGAFSQMLSFTDLQGVGTAGAAGTSHGDGVGRDHTMSRALQARDEFARRLGIEDQSAASNNFAWAIGVGTPKAVDIIKADLQKGGKHVDTETITAAVNEAKSNARTHGFDRIEKLTENYVKSEDFKNLSKTDQGLADRISADVRSSQMYTEGASSAFRQSEEYRQAAERVQSAAFSGKLDWTPEFHRWMREYHPDRMGATGEELWGYAAQFFREADIGVDRAGNPTLDLFGGGGNITPLTSGTYADGDALAAQAARANVGGSAASAAAYGRSGMAQVLGQGTQAISEANAAPGAAPTDGASLEGRRAESKEKLVEKYNQQVSDANAQRKADDAAIKQAYDDAGIVHAVTEAGSKHRARRNEGQ